MATHFTLPKQQIVDTIGRPVSGAKAYFYAPSTTTPKNVYSDAGLTTPHAHPVVADSYGRLPVIYFGSGQYKVVLTTSADVAIYTADNIDPSISSGLSSLPIAQGGTGATSAAVALANLGGATASDVTDLAAEVASVAASSVIVGEVRQFGFTSVPSLWLECNGAAISRTTYSALFAAIGTSYGVGDGTTTFNIPETRGEFIRGFDNARGVDTSRVFGAHQSEMVGPHTHTVPSFTSGFDAASGKVLTGLNTAGTDPTTAVNSGTENRPRNTTFMFCIYAGV